MNSVSKFFHSNVAGPVVAFLIVAVLVSLTTGRFLQTQNLINVSLQVSIVAIVSIGATFVILTGGIDLSPGSTVALVTCALAILVKKQGLPVPVGIVLVLMLGVILGFVNGFLSTYGRIPSFIVTLATHEHLPGTRVLDHRRDTHLLRFSCVESIVLRASVGSPAPILLRHRVIRDRCRSS